MTTAGGSYIKKNGKLELVERTAWEKDAEATGEAAPAARAGDGDLTPVAEGGKGNSGKKGN